MYLTQVALLQSGGPGWSALLAHLIYYKIHYWQTNNK